MEATYQDRGQDKYKNCVHIRCVANMDATAQEGCHSLANTYWVTCKKGRNSRGLLSGKIANFMIPPHEPGVETRTERARTDSFLFAEVGQIDAQHV